MQIGKWGNSLAVRVPAVVVDMLKLQEGDEIEVVVAGERRFEIARDRGREDALAQLKALNLRLPPGYSFKRADAYED